MQKIRCKKCNKLLFKISKIDYQLKIEIKCSRCKTIFLIIQEDFDKIILFESPEDLDYFNK